MESHEFGRCDLCRNSGHVTIYDIDDVRDAYRSQKAKLESGYPRRQLAAVPCKCKLGDKYAVRTSRGEKVQIPRYGQSWWHVRVNEPGKDCELLHDIVRDVQAALGERAQQHQFTIPEIIPD